MSFFVGAERGSVKNHTVRVSIVKTCCISISYHVVWGTRSNTINSSICNTRCYYTCVQFVENALDVTPIIHYHTVQTLLIVPRNDLKKNVATIGVSDIVTTTASEYSTVRYGTVPHLRVIALTVVAFLKGLPSHKTAAGNRVRLSSLSVLPVV